MASTAATRRSGRYYVTRNAEGKLINVPIDDQRGKYYVAQDANGKLLKEPMAAEPSLSKRGRQDESILDYVRVGITTTTRVEITGNRGTSYLLCRAFRFRF